MERIRFFICVVALITLTTACGAPTPMPGPSQVWILEPLEGANLPLAPYLLRFQGASFTGIEAFDVTVNGVLLGVYSPLSSESGGPDFGTMFYGEATWDPQMGGNYTIQVRARNANYDYSPFAEVHVTVTGGAFTEMTPASFQIAPSPTPTKGSWKAVAILDVNCRLGPGTDHETSSFVREGETVEVIGRNFDGFWLALRDPRGEGLCWASIVAFELDFDVADLPIIAVSSPPSPTETNTSGATGCLITNPTTGLDECISPCPAGAAGPPCTP